MFRKNTTIFIVCALIWEIVVGILYGCFFRVNQTAAVSMNTVTDLYSWSLSPTRSQDVYVNTTQNFFPQMVLLLAIVLLIVGKLDFKVGFAMIAGYIERHSMTGMTFTVLIFALTVQNFFIYRVFWEYASVNNPNSSDVDFNTRYYQKLNYINYGNTLQAASTVDYQYASASLFDAIGASLAMFAGYSAVIGRIGFA